MAAERSQRAKWALEDLPIDYASKPVDMHEGQQNADAYRALHPLKYMRPPGMRYDPNLAIRGRGDFATRAGILSKALADSDHPLGSGFSGADILMGHSCFMATHMGQLGDHPVLEAYYARLRQRPAHQRAYGG